MTDIEELENYGINITEDMKHGKVVVDVYTVWCGPCKFVSPILEKIKDEGLIKLLKVDLDQNRPLGNKFGITAIPTLLFFKDGKMVNGIIEYYDIPKENVFEARRGMTPSRKIGGHTTSR